MEWMTSGAGWNTSGISGSTNVMPKKKVSKVKKGKAGKLKNEGKQESKATKGLDIEKAKVNAAIWQVKLQVTEQSLLQYRETCHKLAGAKEDLTNQLYRVEKDAIDMITFFQNQDAQKEEKISVLQESLRNQKVLAQEEQKRLVEAYTLQINEMKELFQMRSSDFNMIQDELKKIKEFQKKKVQMEQELIDMKTNMDSADKEHRETCNAMEYRFFKEKARLEKETEQRMELEVEKAHKEAILKLDDASLSIFKENVRLKEALKYHMKETEVLQKRAEALAEENSSLALNKSTFDTMVRKNAAQMKTKNEELSNLKAKVATLEQDLELKGTEFEREKEKNLASAKASQAELEKLQKAVAVREKELRSIKQLVSSVAKQRTELEEFFHEALAQVKQEITTRRLQYRKEDQQAYRWRMREATAGKLKFPLIRTFHKSPHSTNSVYLDMEVAEIWTHGPGSKVEISDLTWEHKEQVLRLLFAKMNGQRPRKASQRLAFRASSEKSNLPVRDATGQLHNDGCLLDLKRSPPR
ncbi:basal body-orientation factor 1-like isoform X2 [Thalassophryne amazonica]|uniref:basal body-orientation factor 1-like isoform X2 n=1 Tax=Thalassophryne amazonica TaxID=390379 RepID=UPI001471091A|nr:basal body-orientation factor 1-like isoform X2 [Thalassophryne amazonica]